MNNLDNDMTTADQPRPVFLKVLCILTFITTGLGLLSGLTGLFSGPLSDEDMIDSNVKLAESISDLKKVGMDSWVPMMEKIQSMSVQANDHYYLALTLSLMTAAVGLFAAMKMWNGFKIGFHLYIVYSLISLLSIYLYVNPSSIPGIIVIFNLFFSALFIFMYSRNLSWMKK